MRGTDHQPSHMFSYLSPEARARKNHPLRVVRTLVDEVLRALSPQFDRMYASEGRPSISPRLQHAVSLVRKAESGRGGVAPDGVHEEPGPTAGS